MLEVANDHPNDFNYQLDKGNNTLELVKEQSRPLGLQLMCNCIDWVENWLRSDKRTAFDFTAPAKEFLFARLNNTREMLTREMTPQPPQTPPTSSSSTSNTPSSLSLANNDAAAAYIPGFSSPGRSPNRLRSRFNSLSQQFEFESDELLDFVNQNTGMSMPGQSMSQTMQVQAQPANELLDFVVNQNTGMSMPGQSMSQTMQVQAQPAHPVTSSGAQIEQPQWIRVPPSGGNNAYFYHTATHEKNYVTLRMTEL